MDRRDGREKRRHLLLAGLAVMVCCAACASGTATPNPRTTDSGQEAIQSVGDTAAPYQQRLQAVQTLQKMGPTAEEAVPTLLVQVLRDEAPRMRSQMVGVLGQIGPSDEVVPVLIQVLMEDKDREVRGHAASVLCNIGQAKDVVPVLIQAMENDPQTRWAIAEGLWRIGPEAAAAVPALIQALQDECASEIEEACEVERFAIVRALRAITGQDLAEDASAWQAWWDEQQ